jgi:hypothetical protein
VGAEEQKEEHGELMETETFVLCVLLAVSLFFNAVQTMIYVEMLKVMEVMTEHLTIADIKAIKHRLVLKGIWK